MQISRGEIKSAQKVVVYGPEGIGKSTFAAKFPNPVFIDTEGSTKRLDVARTPRPSSWIMLMEQVRYFRDTPGQCSTLVIDTADWAERLCIEHICARFQVSGIEDFGYGKGYVYLEEEFGRLLNLLEELVARGIHVVITAHAQTRKFEEPDEMGAYDRWEMKLQKKTAPLVKEWADTVLFANYKTYVVNVDSKGVAKGKNKAQGGHRVMYTAHHPCWDAKNRHNLAAELKLDYNEIAHCIDANPPVQLPTHATTPPPVEPVHSDPPASRVSVGGKAAMLAQADSDINPKPAASAPTETAPPAAPATLPPDPAALDPAIPKALADLMRENNVLALEIQLAVAKRGYYTIDTPFEKYDPAFVQGVLIGAWPQVLQIVQEIRKEDIPF